MHKNFVQKTGFSLIELLITLSILGILLLLGYSWPSARLAQSRRLEAEQSLSALAIAMEQYALERGNYSGATLELLHIPEWVAGHHYQLNLRASESDYTLTANPDERQAQQDIACGSLTLNARGEKNVTGTGKISDCW